MLLSPRKAPRAVSKVPYKVLDAPELADDFYLNLVDWGSSDVLGVGLGSCVYMWNSKSGRVTKLCDLQDDIVTSVNWIQRVSIFTQNLRRSILIPHFRARTSQLERTRAMFRFGMQNDVGVYEL